MLAINTETEKRYTAVADGLTDMGYQPQTGVMIAANIVGICQSIINSKPPADIIEDYNLGCKPESFNGIFRTYTGIAVRDVPTVVKNEEKISKLRDMGYGDKEIGEILDIMKD